MRKFSKLAALCAVFLLTCCLFSPVALAVEEPEPHTPAIAATESAIPTEDEAVTDEPSAGEAEATEETGTGETETDEPDVAAEDVISAAIPAGTGTVVETATAEDGREFYTISTPAGNVFYLIIDFSRQTENVYFLDAVTEKDLLALAEKPDDTESTENASVISTTETAEPEPNAEPEQQAADDSNMSNIILIVVVVAGIGGAGFYFKVYRKKKDAGIQDEYEPDELDDSAGQEYEANEPEYDYGDLEEDQEDDSPPWDEDEDSDSKDVTDAEDPGYEDSDDSDEPDEAEEDQEDEE